MIIQRRQGQCQEMAKRSARHGHLQPFLYRATFLASAMNSSKDIWIALYSQADTRTFYEKPKFRIAEGF